MFDCSLFFLIVIWYKTARIDYHPTHLFISAEGLGRADPSHSLRQPGCRDQMTINKTIEELPLKAGTLMTQIMAHLRETEPETAVSVSYGWKR